MIDCFKFSDYLLFVLANVDGGGGGGKDFGDFCGDFTGSMW